MTKRKTEKSSGGAVVREKYGSAFFAEIGGKGGNRTKERHGPGFYSEIGRKGGKVSKKSKELDSDGQE